jgi:hypothetical protein
MIDISDPAPRTNKPAAVLPTNAIEDTRRLKLREDAKLRWCGCGGLAGVLPSLGSAAPPCPPLRRTSISACSSLPDGWYITSLYGQRRRPAIKIVRASGNADGVMKIRRRPCGRDKAAVVCEAFSTHAGPCSDAKMIYFGVPRERLRKPREKENAAPLPRVVLRPQVHATRCACQCASSSSCARCDPVAPLPVAS